VVELITKWLADVLLFSWILDVEKNLISVFRVSSVFRKEKDLILGFTQLVIPFNFRDFWLPFRLGRYFSLFWDYANSSSM